MLTFVCPLTVFLLFCRRDALPAAPRQLKAKPGRFERATGCLSTEALDVDSFIETYIMYMCSNIKLCGRVTSRAGESLFLSRRRANPKSVAFTLPNRITVNLSCHWRRKPTFSPCPAQSLSLSPPEKSSSIFRSKEASGGERLAAQRLTSVS